VSAPLTTGHAASAWRFDPAVAGAGLFFDLASHGFDLLDFLIGPVTGVSGIAVNSGGTYAAEDVTAAAFALGGRVPGTGIWNFNASRQADRMIFEGSGGQLDTPIFSDTDVIVRTGAVEHVHDVRNPPHVHQPLIQAIVDELRGGPPAPSTGISAARTSLVLDRCVAAYYGRAGH
jgi:predicted dehydrogenase